MKRFVVSTMVASLAFIGAGAVVDKVIGSGKSDEKALEIIGKARTAIGGDSAIAGVRAFVIKGQTSKTISINGVDRIEQGDTEIVFESPNRLMKMVKIGDHATTGGDAIIEKKVDVVVVGEPGEGGVHKVVVDGKEGTFTSEDGKKVMIRKVEGAPAGEGGETRVFVRKKADGGEWTTKEDENVKEIVTGDGKKFTVVTRGGDGNATFTSESGEKVKLHAKAIGHGAPRDNELLRTTLSLLLTAPEGMDVSYKYAGSTNLEGTNAETVIASFGGSNVKLFFDASSYLPLGMSYVAHPQPIMIKMRKADDGTAPKEVKDVVTFDRKADGAWVNAGAEHIVRFADYRSVNGLMLPYKWTTSVAGKQSDVFDVASYDLNPANISERFKGEGHKVMVRTAKPTQK